MKVAKAKGRLRGKQPKLNRGQKAHLVSLVDSGEYSTAEAAELFGVGRSTVYRAIERQRVEARAGLAEANRGTDTSPRRRLSRIRHLSGTPAPHQHLHCVHTVRGSCYGTVRVAVSARRPGRWTAFAR